MSWNYRVIKHAEQQFSIHEVYYDEEGKPHSMTVDPVSAFGETLEELKDDLLLISVALTKPVLDAKMFDKKMSTNDAEKYVTNTAIDILKKCSNKTSKE